MSNNDLEQKYLLTNDALCYVVLWKQEFKKQLFLEEWKSENEKIKYFKTVEKFIDNLKKALNEKLNLHIE